MWLHKLFNPNYKKADLPLLHFGRYSDAYKSDAQHAAWEEAVEAFEAKDYLRSYTCFFAYLHDEMMDNVYVDRRGDTLHFELIQGSKKVYGTANTEKLRARAVIARVEELEGEWLHRLLDKNYGLRYSRFALTPQKEICIQFDTYTIDGSPFKLYQALKELAIQADKQDDLLVEEFEGLHPVGDEPILSIPKEERHIRYHYLQKWLKETLSLVQVLDAQTYDGAISYALLGLAYRIDYLIAPEGLTLDTIERVQRIYFSHDKRQVSEKNQDLYKALARLQDRQAEEYYREMYRVRATFGLTTQVGHGRIQRMIGNDLYGELNAMNWEQLRAHPRLITAVPDYIVGYCLFNYAVPKPIRELFHLYYCITTQPFFNALGFDYRFVNGQGKVQKRNVLQAIQRIVKDNALRYPNLDIPSTRLQFSAWPDFLRSYMWMIRDMKW